MHTGSRQCVYRGTASLRLDGIRDMTAGSQPLFRGGFVAPYVAQSPIRLARLLGNSGCMPWIMILTRVDSVETDEEEDEVDDPAAADDGDDANGNTGTASSGEVCRSLDEGHATPDKR
jgi:hypothetical protein